MGTSGKLFLKSAPSFSIMKVFICSLLVAGASCLPAADPQLLYHAAPVPVLYHHNCTNAEADPLLLYGAAPLLPAAPVVPLLKHVCDEIQQEYCYPETKVVEDTTTVKRCVFKNTVECTDVEHKIPKTICEPVAALPAPIAVDAVEE